MHASGLKVIVPKCSFGLKEINYLGYIITREGIKTNPKKVQGIMALGRTASNDEAWALIGMFKYYRDMWLRWSHTLFTLTVADICPKVRKVLWNDALERSFKEIKRMVSSEMLLSCPEWKLPFTFDTDTANKQFGAIISQNYTTFAFLLRILSKT